MQDHVKYNKLLFELVGSFVWVKNVGTVKRFSYVDEHLVCVNCTKIKEKLLFIVKKPLQKSLYSDVLEVRKKT